LADAVPVLAGSWVVATLAVSGLVAHAGTGAARAASRYVRRWLLLSDGLLIVGLVTAALTSRTTQLSGLATAPSGRHGWLVLAAAFVAAAGVVRSSLVPGSRWLPETAEAPSPVSALLHAGLVNAVGVVSLLVWPLMAQAAVVRFGLVVVGALTAVVATAAMRTRPDVKGRLAASTSSQMGYLAVQVGLGLPAAVLAHVVGHGLWKAGLFLGAGGAVDRVRAGAGAVRDVASLGRRAAVGLVTAVVVLVAAQVPLGLPVLVGEPAELLPLLLATVAVTVAVAHGTRIGPALLAAIGYVIGLRLLTQAIAEAAEPVSFGRVADVVLILALVAAAALLAVVDARASQGRLPALAAGTAWLSLIPSSVAAGSSAGGARRLRRRLRAAGARPLPAPDVEVSAERVEQVRHEVDIASAVVAPAWPLASFVASNPLAGLEGLPFADALEAASRSWTTPPLREGGQDVALQWSRYVANFVTARALADAEWPCPTAPSIWETTRAEGAHVARAVGRPDAGAWLAALPADPAAALAVLIDGRFGGLELSEATTGLAQLLARDPGWAAHLAWRRREGRDGGDAAELLALRLALDVLLDLDRMSDAATAHGDNTLPRADAAASVVPSVDLTSLEAREEEWRAPVLAALARRAAQDGSATLEAPLGQVVLCIDVRSERLRRQLEALGPWETFGAAGFFGVTLQHESASGAVSARCPALVRPGFAATSAAALPASRPSSAAGVGAVSSAPVLPFALAEASGWVTGPAAESRPCAPPRGTHRSA
ncbi:MAG: putative inorganic carbon transporter subunit DabA, partial [Actinomycetes bacterium]